MSCHVPQPDLQVKGVVMQSMDDLLKRGSFLGKNSEPCHDVHTLVRTDQCIPAGLRMISYMSNTTTEEDRKPWVSSLFDNQIFVHVVPAKFGRCPDSCPSPEERPSDGLPLQR